MNSDRPFFRHEKVLTASARRQNHRQIKSIDKNIPPSHLPSSFLPCAHCGRPLAITAVAPARLGNGAASNNLEDVTHTCVQCGMVLISTRRPFSDATNPTADRV
jgi:hypothetical protein